MAVTNTTSSPTSTLRIDDQARRSIVAQNQQRVLASIGMLKQGQQVDSFSMSPLKGLLSSAANSYTDALKKSSSAAKLGKGTGSYGKADEIRKQIEAENEAANTGVSTTTVSVTGNTDEFGVTIDPTDDAPVVPTAGDEAKKRLTKMLGTISNAGGELKANDNGTISFKVNDAHGVIYATEKGDVVIKTRTTNGVVTARQDSNGAVSFTNSAADDAESDRVANRMKEIISNNASGLNAASRNPVTTVEPAEPAPAEGADAPDTGDTVSGPRPTATTTTNTAPSSDPRLKSNRGIDFSPAASTSTFAAAMMVEMDNTAHVDGHNGELRADSKEFRQEKDANNRSRWSYSSSGLTGTVRSNGVDYSVAISNTGAVSITGGSALSRGVLKASFDFMANNAKNRVASLNVVA